MQPLKQAVQQQQQQQDCGLKRQPGQPQGVSGDACAAVGGTSRGSSSADAADAAAAANADAAAAIPPSLPEVDFLEKIGRGSFGDVFKGAGQAVARLSRTARPLAVPAALCLSQTELCFTPRVAIVSFSRY
jgi:hypothetical protein